MAKTKTTVRQPISNRSAMPAAMRREADTRQARVEAEKAREALGLLRGTIYSIPGGGQMGYGWIAGDDGINRFFHRSVLNPPEAFDTLRVTQRVLFRHIDAARGPRAIDVELVTE